MKKLLLFAAMCVFGAIGTLKAQSDEVVIDGTVGSYSEYMNQCAPLFASTQNSISQQYYTAEEIGRENGTIKSIAFKTEKTWNETSPRRLDLYLVNTENEAFNGLSMEQLSIDDLVFSGNVTFSSNSWVAIKFNKKDFEYTGGNILVCVNDVTGSANSGNNYFTSFFIPQEEGVRCLWNTDELIPFDPIAAVVEAKETSFSVPYIKFIFGEIETIIEPTNDEVVIDGTIGSYSEYMNHCAPLFASAQNSISQQYYTAEEIGREADTIKSIAFKTENSWNETSPRRLDLYLVNTENEAFNGLSMEQLFIDDLVFSGNVTFSPNSWTTIDFNKKNFNYTGGNILVCVNDVTGSANFGNNYFTSFFVPQEEGVRCLWNTDELIPFDPIAAVVEAKETSFSVPYIKFIFGKGVASITEQTSSFNIYPNPVTDKLFIETEANVVEVVVYDVYGRQQTTVNGQQSLSIDVNGLNSGIYFVKVRTDNGDVVKRFVKK